ncbi:MAG TPA: M55 family metallopeptidase [Fimbriimonadaceae bacterium]|jgi:D-amino peptidase
MKVFISADIEGCTGIVSFSQCGGPSGDHYDFAFARRMMTHDVNAAIRGAKAAGAKLVVVKDGHAHCKNLLIDELEPGTELISGAGSGKYGMMDGIDETFDASMLIGYHAMAGTPEALMEHALVGGLHRFWINGVTSGEIAANAALAGHFGVPVVMVSSDEAGASEAQSLGCATYATKSASGKYTGRVKHPSETGPGIEAAAKEGCNKVKSIKPFQPATPVTMRAEFHKVEEVDMVVTLEGIERLDGYTVEWTRPDYLAAHAFAYNVFSMSIRGRTAAS